MLHKWKATQVVTKQLSLPLLAWQASSKASSTGHYLELLLKQKSNDNNLLLWRRVVGEWLMTVALRKSPSRINERLFTYRGNPFSPFLICRKNLYACDQQNAWNENPNPVLAQALNSPGHEPKPGWVMERDTPHRHTELRCIMTSSSCLTSPATSHIDLSFPSPAFSTTRVPALNPWDYPAGVELSVPWFQPKPPLKALVRLYDFSKWIWSYREESDTFTGPEAAQLCWVHTAPSLDVS